MHGQMESLNPSFQAIELNPSYSKHAHLNRPGAGYKCESREPRCSLKVIGVPAKKIWGSNEVLPKFCDVCPNHDFLAHYG